MKEVIQVAEAVFIDKDKRVLLVQQKKKIVYKKWSFPGGRVEANENPEEAVKREVLEEIGLVYDKPTLLTNYKIEGDTAILDIYSYRDDLPAGKITLKEDELFAYKWFTIEQMRNEQDLRSAEILKVSEKALE